MDRYALLQAKLDRLQSVQQEFRRQYEQLLQNNAQLQELAHLHACTFAAAGDTTATDSSNLPRENFGMTDERMNLTVQKK
jgi:hypothetical protein